MEHYPQPHVNPKTLQAYPTSSLISGTTLGYKLKFRFHSEPSPKVIKFFYLLLSKSFFNKRKTFLKLIRSPTWWFFKKNRIINLYNKKKKYNKKKIRYNTYELRLNSNLLIKKEHLATFQIYDFFFEYNCYMYLRLVSCDKNSKKTKNNFKTYLALNFYKSNLSYFRKKWEVQYSLSNPLNYTIPGSVRKQQLLINNKEKFIKSILKNKVNYYSQLKVFSFLLTGTRSFNVNWGKPKQFLFFDWITNFKFLWRYKFFLNLLIIYSFVILNQHIQISANLLIDYLAPQFRTIFSKHEHRYLIKFIIRFISMFARVLDKEKFSNIEQLLFCQIIITGRWQRKRWVRPFPTVLTSKDPKFFKMFIKHRKEPYITSMSSKEVWTQKGVITFWITLFFKQI